MWRRYDDGGGFQDRRHVAHHHSEAMVERYRHTDAIARRDHHALGHEQRIVENIVMAQDGSLRMACRSRRVLDVDRFIEGETSLSLPQLREGHAISHREDLIPAEETIRMGFVNQY